MIDLGEMVGATGIPEDDLPNFVRKFLAEHLLEDLYEQRKWVIWRTTRKIAEIRGLLGSGQLLSEMKPVDDESPWQTRFCIQHTGSIQKWVRNVLDLHKNGLPLSPFCEESAENRKKIQISHLVVASQLELSKGTAEDVHKGYLGLRGLDEDFEQFLRYFPPPADIISYEKDIVKQAQLRSFGSKLGGSRLELLNWLENAYGLTASEAITFLNICTRLVADSYADTLSSRKASMLARLESVADRAREAMNTSIELSAARQMILVDGLTAKAGSEAARAMMEALRGNPELPELEPPRRNRISEVQGLDAAKGDGIE